LRLICLREGGRRAAVEILRGSPLVSKTILEGRVAEISHFLEGRQGGMQSFDQHLVELHRAGLISGTETLRRCTNPEVVGPQLRAGKPSPPRVESAAPDPSELV
jgi:Tfp pilus assembly ATPase PilU